MRKSTYIAITLLIAGGCIYATCRQDVLFLAPFRQAWVLEQMQLNIRYQQGSALSYFFLFCLSDMLWYMALLLLQMQFYRRDNALSKVLFLLSALLPFLLELLQYLNLISGTFDMADICAYLFTLMLFCLLWKRKEL